MRRTALISLALLAACAGDPYNGGQSGSEGAVCAVTSSVDLAAGEDSPLGFAPDDVLAYAGGAHSETLAWEDGGSSPLTVTFTATGTARYEERAWEDDGSGMEIALDGCGPTVVIPGTLTLVTDGGELDEQLAIELDATDGLTATWWADIDGFDGSYTPDTTGFDDFRTFASGRFDASGTAGEITGQGENIDADVASATHVPIASWGAAQ